MDPYSNILNLVSLHSSLLWVVIFCFFFRFLFVCLLLLLLLLLLLGNNEVSTEDGTTSIRDGYYNVYELDEEVFQPLGAELSLHAPTGRSQLSAKKRLVLVPRAAILPGETYTADKPHRLAIHQEICVHLAEISTSENLHSGRPSTLLRSVPVENERCGVVGRRPSLLCTTKGWRLMQPPADSHGIRRTREKIKF